MNKYLKAGLLASPGIVWLLGFPVAWQYLEGGYVWWKIYLIEFIFVGAGVSIPTFARAMMILEE